MMKNTKVHWLLIAITSIGLLGAAEEERDLHPYGLRPLCREDVEKLEKCAKKVVHVRQNCLAKQRALSSEIEQDSLEMGEVGTEEEYVLMDISSEDALFSLSADDAILPERVNNAKLPSFPPIGYQGGIGSCVAWGSTYYQATHEIGLLNGYDNRNSFEHVLSPKWTYNILNGGVNNGLTIYDASNLLAVNGAPTIVEFPYDSSFTSWTVNKEHWLSGIKNRMAPYVLIPGIGGASQNLTAIKTALANGHVLTFPTFITSWKMIRIKADPENINNRYVGESAVHYMAGRDGPHFMTIVGYDDTLWIDVNGNGKVDSGERGAFLVANSFGRTWGNAGFMWVSYDAFLTRSAVVGAPTLRRVAITDPVWTCISAVPIAKNYRPSLIAEFSITTARRQELWVTGGISPTNMTVPTTKSITNYALDFNGGPLTFEGTTSTVPTTGSFVMDFTELLTSNATTPVRYHLQVMDGRVGNPSTVNSYILKDLIHNIEIPAARTPITVDGTNVARLFVDYAFNQETVPQVDNLTVAILSPSKGALIAETVTLTAQVTSVSSITSVALSIDSIPMGNLTFADGVYKIDVNTERLANGSHVFMLTTTNSAGNVDKTTRVFNVNNMGLPNLVVKQPVRGGTINGVVLLSVVGTSPTPITTVSVAVDSLFVGNLALVNGKYEFLLDTLPYENGAHVLTFTAYNTGGRQYLLDVNVVINNTETPTITIVTPVPDSIVEGVVPLSVRATSTIGIRNVSLKVDSRPAGDMTLSDGAYTTIVDTTELTNGDHKFDVAATNSSGDYSETTWFVTVSNTDIPVISVLSPGNGATVSGSVPFSVRATSGASIETVSLVVDSIPWGNLAPSSGNYAITVDTTALANGSHTFQFIATDSTGKTARATATLTVSNVDSPVVSVEMPTNGATINGQVSLTVVATGISPITQVALTVDSTPMGLLRFYDGKYKISLDTTKFSNGNHILKFAATNSSGKITVATVTVNVSNVDSPVVTIQGIAEGATINGMRTLSVTASGISPIAQIALTVDSTPMGLLKFAQGAYTIPLDTTKFSNGSHILKFAATNSGGKTTVATVMVNVSNVDSPVITIQGIPEGTTISGTKTLSATVTGISPITQLALTVDSTPMGLLKFAQGAYRIPLDTTKFSNGSHILKFAATNSGGKMTVAAVSVNISN